MSEERLREVAANQHGVVSLEQARAHGLTDRQTWYRAEAGSWIRLYDGVFRMGGAPDTWRARLMAACLAAGSGAMASHLAAGRLWRLVEADDDPVEIIVGTAHTGRLSGARLHRCNLLLPADRRVVDAIPVTGPELTLLHLAAVMHTWRVDGLIDRAIRRRLSTLAKLRRRLMVLGRRGRNGSGALRAVLDARDPEGAAAESRLEREFFSLVRGSDLPRPKLQHLITESDGSFVARVDAAWPEVKLAVELDGSEFHAPLARWTGDLERQNRLVALGWTVLRFTWWDVIQRPGGVQLTLHHTFSVRNATTSVGIRTQNVGDRG